MAHPPHIELPHPRYILAAIKARDVRKLQIARDLLTDVVRLIDMALAAIARVGGVEVL